MATKQELIKNSIVTVPDYPKKGIMFRDVTSLLEDHKAFQATIDLFVEHFRSKGFTKIVGAEARGFIFGAPLALALKVGFVPVRKPGKLPRETASVSYTLEYGEDTLEIHKDSINSGDRVLIIDDLLATGGTITAAIELVRGLGGQVEDVAFVVSLPELGGEKKLRDLGINMTTLCEFEGE